MYLMRDWMPGAGVRTSLRRSVWIIVLAAIWALKASAQLAGGNRIPAQTLLLTPDPARVEGQVEGEVVREIDDPHTGDRWLLMRNPAHPEGPGRLVRATANLSQAGRGAPAEALPVAVLTMQRTQFMPIIHTGDRLIVEEKTAVVEARLEAVALSPAVSGSPLHVRLTIGGNVVRAVALGPGRAVLAPEAEAQP